MKITLLSVLAFAFSLTLTAQTEDLRVFPNPVTTTFEIGHSDRVVDIRILNMVGRQVKQFDYAADETYDITDLPQGMYLVQLRDGSDDVVHTQRIKKN